MGIIGNPLLLGEEGGGGGGDYAIERSLRFSSADSAYLSRVPASAGNRKTWTWAGWVKRSAFGSTPSLFSVLDGGSIIIFGFESSETLRLQGSGINVITTPVYRDPSAWYHVVLSFDTTQATAADRVKIHVNGAIQGVSGTYPTLNTDYSVNVAAEHQIASYNASAGRFFDGYLADVHFIDGQALDPTDFGEFDANGIWQPIQYAGTFGTNGFHLPFSNAATADTLAEDASGNGNHWTPNNITPLGQASPESGVITAISATPVYSSYTTGTPYSAGSEPLMFNGNLTDYCTAGIGQTMSWTPPTPIPITSKAVVYVGAYSGTGANLLVVNGVDYSSLMIATANPSVWRTPDITDAQLTSITWTIPGASVFRSPSAVEVDGTILIDGATTLTLASDKDLTKFSSGDAVNQDSGRIIESDTITAVNATAAPTTYDARYGTARSAWSSQTVLATNLGLGTAPSKVSTYWVSFRNVQGVGGIVYGIATNVAGITTGSLRAYESDDGITWTEVATGNLGEFGVHSPEYKIPVCLKQYCGIERVDQQLDTNNYYATAGLASAILTFATDKDLAAFSAGDAVEQDALTAGAPAPTQYTYSFIDTAIGDKGSTVAQDVTASYNNDIRSLNLGVFTPSGGNVVFDVGDASAVVTIYPQASSGYLYGSNDLIYWTRIGTINSSTPAQTWTGYRYYSPDSTSTAYTGITVGSGVVAPAPSGTVASTDATAKTMTLATSNGTWSPNTGNYVIGPAKTASGTVASTDVSSQTMTLSSSTGLWSANAGKYVIGPNTLSSTRHVDSLRDSPTNGDTANDTGLGGELEGNYATWNPLIKAVGSTTNTYANGNLDGTINIANTGAGVILSNFGMSSGKWYWETVITSASVFNVDVGIVESGTTGSIGNGYSSIGQVANGYSYYAPEGNVYNNGSGTSYGSTYASGDVIGIAFDADTGKLWFAKNGTWQASGDPAAGTNAAFSSITTGKFYVAGWGVVSGSTESRTYTAAVNFGQRPYIHPAPAGFQSLCTANLPEPTIKDGSKAMDVALYTGNGGTQTISGLGFSPDLVWMKSREASNTLPVWYDSVRGAFKMLRSNSNAAEIDYTSVDVGVTNFGANSFTIKDNTSGDYNINGAPGGTYAGAGASYVAWTWDAGSSTVTNNNGTITSQVRANPSAGFSIVEFTGSTSSYTVGHGLNVAPVFYIIKASNGVRDWPVYTTTVDGSLDYLYLNRTDAKGDAGNSAPTSTVVYPDQLEALDYVMYCFAPVEGYSAFGSYVGNGSATDGPFVYTGFRPRWILVKNSSNSAGYNWFILDGKRSPYNKVNDALLPNRSDSEDADNSGYEMDFLSNGFRVTSTNSVSNGSGDTYIYAAFSENPFKYARAR